MFASYQTTAKVELSLFQKICLEHICLVRKRAMLLTLESCRSTGDCPPKRRNGRLLRCVLKKGTPHNAKNRVCDFLLMKGESCKSHKDCEDSCFALPRQEETAKGSALPTGIKGHDYDPVLPPQTALFRHSFISANIQTDFLKEYKVFFCLYRAHQGK